MALEHHKCKAELPITDIVEAEIKQISCGSYGNIHDILIGEIKEEATEVKPISEYGVAIECSKNEENGEFYDSNLDSSKFEVMLRDSIEDPTESKISPAHFWENENFNGLANELVKQKVNHFDNGVIVKYEDHSEGNDESLTNNVELKMKTLKNEDDIDIFYEDVKPEICDAEANGKSENGSHLNSDILIGTEIRPNFSYEFSKDSKTWPQQNIEEDGTVLGSDNDTRKESTVTIESKNCRMIQNLPHCRYTEFHSFDSKQDFNGIPDTEKKQFQCLSCSKTFTKKNIFLHHERIHTGEKPFQCKICSKSFRVKSSLLYHDRIHTGENPFSCKICLKSFKWKGNLTAHIRIHSGGKPFQCKACPKSFIQKEYLKNHERIHTGEKPFSCKICLKSFTRKENLTTHIRIHSGEKPFQCKACPKSFIQKEYLKNHERIHTGEKPFQCKICSKSYRAKSSLLYHVKIHTHLRIHSGEKPFQCQICPKSFNDNGNLMNHERMHAVENLFNASFVPVLESRKNFSTDLSNQHSQVKYI